MHLKGVGDEVIEATALAEENAFTKKLSSIQILLPNFLGKEKGHEHSSCCGKLSAFGP